MLRRCKIFELMPLDQELLFLSFNRRSAATHTDLPGCRTRVGKGVGPFQRATNITILLFPHCQEFFLRSLETHAC